MSDWFLPTAERPWTAGNLVVPRVHGADYFARLVEVIEATQHGDRIFCTDWRGDADERLTVIGPTIAELLSSAGRRGVEVRALLWRSHPGTLNSEENNHLGAVINESGGRASSTRECAAAGPTIRRSSSSDARTCHTRTSRSSAASTCATGVSDDAASRRPPGAAS